MFVPVAFTNITLPRFVRPVTARFVVVAFVDVTFVKMPVEGVEAPMAMLFMDPPVRVALPEERLVPVRVVIVAFVAKKLVLVVFVPEAETYWKFWRAV